MSNIFKIIYSALKTKDTLELDQAKFRFKMGFLIIIWFGIISLFSSKISNNAIYIMAGYITVIGIVACQVAITEKFKKSRIYLMMLLDPTMGFLLLSQVQELGTPVLFTMFIPPIGNALRFGKNYFLPAAIFNFIALVLLFTTADYFKQDGIFGFGVIITFVIILFKMNGIMLKLDSLKKQLSTMAMHDNLTGLPNRRLFVEHLYQFIQSSSRIKTQVGCIFIDLDGFKAVNDKFGHGVGDKLIIKVGEELRKQIRNTDIVARLGGDEFVLAAEFNDDKSNLLMIADRILLNIEKINMIDGNEVNISASIGITFYNPLEDKFAPTADILLAQADKAMYKAKNSGKGRIIRYDKLEKEE